MKIPFSLLVLGTLLFFEAASYSQVSTDLAANKIVPGSEIVRFTERSELPDYVKFADENYIPLSGFVEWYKTQFGLGPETDFELLSTERDELGYVHYRFVQKWYNHSVEGTMLILHTRNGLVEAFNGLVYILTDWTAWAGVNKQDALDKAISHIGAHTYKWEIASEEALLKIETNDNNGTYYPKGHLVLAPKEGIFKQDMLDLAYKFDIYAHEPMSRKYVFVSATTGEVIWDISRIHTSDSTGTAVTKYSGSQTIIADFQGPGSFRLREYSRGNGIETYDLNNGTNYGSAVDFTDSDNFWNNINPQQDEVAGDAHWGTEMTYDYYFLEHSRNSIDDNGFLLRSYVHYSTNYVNAFWDGQRMTYGDGNASYSPLVTVDICAHEITHGVTQQTSGLIYSYESGALNESFSDIFGTAAEFYAKPGTANWTMGEEIGSAFRSLSNPNAHNDPDTYLGTYWHPGPGDNGGVHTNSGVQNYWYYVLSEGDTGVNDNGAAFSLPGIGMTKASAIAYRNLAIYLSPSSQYADARFYAIQSAIDLYGNCSAEEIAVTNAWYAVGVGDSFGGLAIDFNADRASTCSGTVRFKSISPVSMASFSWDFGDGNTSAQENPVHTYASNGIFDVKLTITYCGFQDSLQKNSYINVTRPAAPAVTGASICDSGSVTLLATGTGILNWYDAPTGGNLIHTGGSYTTPVLNNTTSYYVEEFFSKPAVKVGPPDNTFGGGAYFAGDHRWLVFDCLSQVKLRTVKVYANQPGDRTIQLRRDDGSILQDTTVSLSIGESKINLNFNIPVDSNLVLAISGFARLYRNDDNVNYPYTAPGLLSITRSNAGAAFNYYYFFYDWEIQEEECKSIRSEVIAEVNSAIPAVVSVYGSNDVCQNDSVRLESNTAASYQWSSGETTRDIWVKTGGSFSVSTIDSNGCSSMSSPVIITILPLPSADAGINSSICFGDTIQLTASGGTSYEWQSSSYLSCSLCAQTDAFPPVTSTFYVEVTDANGCSAQDSITLTVNSLPIANAGSDAFICPGSFSQLQASGGVNYQWTPTVGLNNPNISNPVASPSSTTSYTVAVTDNNGCESVDNMTVTVHPLPQANAGNDTSLCLNESVQLHASGGVIYSWTGSNLSCQNCANPVASPIQTTTYVVNVTDTYGCQNIDSVTVEVNSLPNAGAGQDQGICVGDSAQLSATGGLTYLWSGPSLSCTNCADPNASPATTTIYTVIVTDGNGCQDADNTVITVSSPPLANAGTNQSICQNDSVQLGASGGASYSWSPTQGLSDPFVADPIAFPLSDQIYVVTVTNQFGCSSKDSVIITVHPLPTITAGPDTTICSGDSVQLFASGAISYVWSPASGLNNANIQNPIASLAVAGTNTFVVTGSNIYGCFGSAALDITAIDYPIASFVYLSTGFQVDFTNQSINGVGWIWHFGDGNGSNDKDPIHIYDSAGTYQVMLVALNGLEGPCNDTFILEVKIEPVGIGSSPESGTITLFPNPTSGTLFMVFDEMEEEVEITLTNLLGEVMWQYHKNEGIEGITVNIDLRSFASGTYLVHASGSKSTSTWKIIKE